MRYALLQKKIDRRKDVHADLRAIEGEVGVAYRAAFREALNRVSAAERNERVAVSGDELLKALEWIVRREFANRGIDSRDVVKHWKGRLLVDLVRAEVMEMRRGWERVEG